MSDVLDTAAVVAVVGVAALVGYELLTGHPLAGQNSSGASIGAAIGNTAGTAAASAVTSFGNSILLQGQDTCSLIQEWRNLAAPAICYVANMPIIG